MDKAKIFSGFTPEEKEYYTAEAEKLYDLASVRESSLTWKAYGSEKQKKILEEGKIIYLDIAAAMPLGPEAEEVQQLLPLAENYAADSRFKENFDAIHPGLAEFMGEAVRVYVRNLKCYRPGKSWIRACHPDMGVVQSISTCH